MQPGQPSLTAMGAASHRAAHQLLDGGRIFADPLALPILGRDTADLLREAEEHPARRLLRLFIAVRSRFAEDSLAAAVRDGTRQLVVLGAGLDTFAYRNPFAELRVFEVDHPATQAWKRERLAAAAIAVPPTLTFAPFDFERETLAEALAAAGFDRAQASLFTWLGVTPYLRRETVLATLGFMASLPAAQVVFDYANPPSSLADGDGRAAYEALAARVASVGESFQSYFDTDELRARLGELGFSEVTDLGPGDIAARYFPGAGAFGRDKGGHIVHARR